MMVIWYFLPKLNFGADSLPRRWFSYPRLDWSDIEDALSKTLLDTPPGFIQGFF